MSDIGKLISGFRAFKATTYESQKDIISHVVRQGITPKTLFIICSDLRISIGQIVSANPGDLFVLSNMGALVPEYSENADSSAIANIEYAVNSLEVENIIIMGHARCRCIKMLMSEKFNTEVSGPIKSWLSIAAEARQAVKEALAENTEEEQQAACEQESIVTSLRNLIAYPYISERLDNNTLNVYAWHFDIQTGDIMALDPDTGFFEPIS